ncbi:hypothetical protein BJX99DRAFT_256695 [Aspergillus californicus]
MENSGIKAIRACTDCVRAKARCSPSVLGKCDRCVRMNKECVPSPPVRKRRAARVSKNSQVQKLEKRIDGLVVLLESALHPSPASSTAETELTNTSKSHLSDILSGPEPASATSLNTDPVPQLQPFPAPDPTDAELSLNRFRAVMLPTLPFIVIPPSLTSQELRRESPLLWLSIMAVASARPAQQCALSEEARAAFAREAYVVGSRNLDLLSAILVYTIWDRFHTFAKCPSTALLHLAISIMYDLALDKPLAFDAGIGLMYDVKCMNKCAATPRAPVLKEKRAVLGCFLVSTIRSMHSKGESLKWTPIFDRYLRELGDQKESPSDMVLVQLVKLRLVTENATEYLTLGTGKGTDSPSQLDTTAALKSLESQLRAVKSQIPSDLLANESLVLELHHTEATIYQLGFHTPNPSFSVHANQRFASIYACMQAVKSWIDAFLAVAPEHYVGLSALVHNAMMRCLLNICRLAICDHVEWDSSLLHENIDVSLLLAETAKRFEQAREAAGMEVAQRDVDMHTMLAEKIWETKGVWDSLTTTVPTQELGFMDDLGNFSEEFLGLWDWA